MELAASPQLRGRSRPRPGCMLPEDPSCRSRAPCARPSPFPRPQHAAVGGRQGWGLESRPPVSKGARIMAKSTSAHPGYPFQSLRPPSTPKLRSLVQEGNATDRRLPENSTTGPEPAEAAVPAQCLRRGASRLGGRAAVMGAPGSAAPSWPCATPAPLPLPSARLHPAWG